MENLQESKQQPLCLELEECLCKSNLAFESLFRQLKLRPWSIFLILFQFSRGISSLRQQLLEDNIGSIKALPWNQPLIDYLKAEKENNRPIILISSIPITQTKVLLKDIPIFTEILFQAPSDLSLESVLINRFGKDNFEIITSEKAKGKCSNSSFINWLNMIRIHQWTKNCLLFIPLFASHQIFNIPQLSHSVIAFISFSLCASANYIINDLLDLDNDRNHQIKRHRAIASGAISIPSASLTCFLFLIGAIALSFALNPGFQACLVIYITITTLYSWWLKRIIIIDILILASLYMVRVIAGGEATDTVISYWLLVFSIFFFTSLGFLKRYAELLSHQNSSKQQIQGRSYRNSDTRIIASIGILSGGLSCIVFALYSNSENFKILYKSPEYLWGCCLLIAFWLSRAWLLARKNKMHHDPVVFAIKDKVTYLVIGAFTLLAVLAYSID